MGLPRYLAMTHTEFSNTQQLPSCTAWMACHFSTYACGLSNLPKYLPPESMLIVNDRIPPMGHDPERIAQQILWAIEEFQISCVLLDFQRDAQPECRVIAQKLTETLPVPVGVSEQYAGELACPVLLRCPAPHEAIADRIDPWKDRTVWLELATEQEIATVTKDGCRFSPAQVSVKPKNLHIDEDLCCSYQVEVLPTEASFTLHRGIDELNALEAQAEKLGIRLTVGLFQQLQI